MCLIIERFDVNEFGALIEVGQCGHRRALRGRTVEDIAREEAAFTERQREIMPSVASQRPCAWPSGCDGFAARSSTDYCALHCDERRKQKNREWSRVRAEYNRKRRAA